MALARLNFSLCYVGGLMKLVYEEKCSPNICLLTCTGFVFQNRGHSQARVEECNVPSTCSPSNLGPQRQRFYLINKKKKKKKAKIFGEHGIETVRTKVAAVEKDIKLVIKVRNPTPKRITPSICRFFKLYRMPGVILALGDGTLDIILDWAPPGLRQAGPLPAHFHKKLYGPS